jgi:hypothetical protein
MNKFAVLVGPSGSIFVKAYDFFAYQGGLKESWGKNWTIVETESMGMARVYAMNNLTGRRDALFCSICGEENHGPCQETF